MQSAGRGRPGRRHHSTGPTMGGGVAAALVDHVRTTLGRSAMGLVDLAAEWLSQDDRRLLVLFDHTPQPFFDQRSQRDLALGHDASRPCKKGVRQLDGCSHMPMHITGYAFVLQASHGTTSPCPWEPAKHPDDPV